MNFFNGILTTLLCMILLSGCVRIKSFENATFKEISVDLDSAKFLFEIMDNVTDESGPRSKQGFKGSHSYMHSDNAGVGRYSFEVADFDAKRYGIVGMHIEVHRVLSEHWGQLSTPNEMLAAYEEALRVRLFSKGLDPLINEISTHDIHDINGKQWIRFKENGWLAYHYMTSFDNEHLLDIDFHFSPLGKDESHVWPEIAKTMEERIISSFRFKYTDETTLVETDAVQETFVKKPMADFSATPISGPPPLTVQFTDLSSAGSTPITFREWRFGSWKNTSNELNPSYTFTEEGRYNIYLNIKTSKYQDIGKKEKYITVSAKPIAPTASFTPDCRYGLAPLSVQFTDTSWEGGAPILSWYWSFGDGETNTEENPGHTYKKPGTYTVTLTVTNSAGTDTVVSNELVTGALGQTSQPVKTETYLLPGGVPLEMVCIEPGAYFMGRFPTFEDKITLIIKPDELKRIRELPQHKVVFERPFWVGKYELTKAQWTALMGTTPWTGHHFVLDDPLSPAVCISWDDATAFIAKLNTLTGKEFRLPSEAEWEYACRAGTVTRYYWGNDDERKEIYNNANIGRIPIDLYKFQEIDYADIVGLRRLNPWGLYDMNGNVWEWCQDWYGNYSSDTVVNPGGPESGIRRVLRGGAWNSHGVYVYRSAFRTCYLPTRADVAIGFRLAR